MRQLIGLGTAVLLALAVGLAGAGNVARPAAAEPSAAPAADLDPVLKKLGTLVGGKWVTEFKNKDGQPFGELRFTWGPDGRTIHGEGVIGHGTPKPQPVQARFGWDPAAKKVYYLDMHGPDTVYFGHIRLEGEELVYDFKAIVGRPSAWVSREVYPDADTCRAVVHEIVDGKPKDPPHRINLKRVP